MDVLEEQLEIIHDGHFEPGPVQLQGRRYYELEDLQRAPAAASSSRTRR